MAKAEGADRRSALRPVHPQRCRPPLWGRAPALRPTSSSAIPTTTPELPG